MRLLRAVRAHAGPVLLLFATTVLSVAAFVVSTAAAGDAARRPVLAPLAALALLVAAGPSVDLARRRRTELALIRLRGARGPSLVTGVAGESVAVVLVSGAVGLAAGGAAVRLLHASWDLPVLIGLGELGPAVLLTGALAVVAAAAAGVVAREPLRVSIRRHSWAGPGATARFVGLVSAIAAVVTAVLAVYSAMSGDPGSLVLAGPVLVGVAAGQLVVWVTRGLSTAAPHAARSRSTALLLGVRRALGAEQGARLRAVVAAGVVAATSACAVAATADWADESARLRQGGPLSLDLPDSSAQAAVTLTRQLDPDGRWLMAAAVNDARDEARNRTAWLDLERYDRVAADFLSSTSADVDGAVDDLRDAPPVTFVDGDAVELAAVSGDPDATVTLAYVDDDGVVSSVVVPVAAGGAVARAEVQDCALACVALGLTSPVPVKVIGLSLGGTDLLAESWAGEDGVLSGPGTVDVRPGQVSRPTAATATQPMLVAGDPDYGGGRAEADDVGGEPRPVEPVGTRPALPLVEGAGLLGDLPVALAGAPGTIPAVRTLVLARADTPDEVIDGLREAGAGPPEALDAARAGLGPQQRAEDRVRRAGLVAAIGLGLLALAVGGRRRRRTIAHDDASLRLVGVRASELRRARLVEGAVLAVLVLAATAAAGWLAAATLVEASGLVPTGPARLPLDASPSVPLVVGVAVAASLATGVAALLGTRRTPSARLAAGEEPDQ